VCILCATTIFFDDRSHSRGFGLGGEDRWWDISDPEIGAGLGERRIMLGTIAEPRKRRSMAGKSENKLRVDGDRVNLRKRLFPALG
jgi:hypothetical protein